MGFAAARVATSNSAGSAQLLGGVTASVCDAVTFEERDGLASARMPGNLRALPPLWAKNRIRTSYATLRPQVARIARALIGDKPPSDLVHDICVEVMLSKSRFRRDCAFSTWMYSIVGHHVHNWIRRERNRRELIRAAEQESLWNCADRPDQALDIMVFLDQLRSGFATLTETQRNCLLLVRWECLSPREVAARLNISSAAVRMNVHRARAHLRSWLDGGG